MAYRVSHFEIMRASPAPTILGTPISIAQFTDPDGNLVGSSKGMNS